MTKTLFIGLDGATFTVLDDLTRELPGVGLVMPFLKRFIENGARATLRSTPNPLTPPAWTSIMTGRGPGSHGVYDFIRAEDKGHEVYFTLYDARDIRTETIWSIAGRQDRRVVALNFPLTAPPQQINGSLVPGFVPWKHLRRNMTPAALYARLSAIPDFNPKELAWDFDREKQALEAMSEDDSEQWVKYHLPREEQWFRIAEFLLREDKPDLMAVLFDGTDKIQHQAWPFLDPALLVRDPSPWEQRMRALCLDYFRNLDRYIERLVGLAGPDVQVFMASDHGFTTTTEVFRVNTFLEERGYLRWRKSSDAEGDRRREDANFADVDWQQTLAYCPTPSSNGIAIRVSRRPGEPGIRPEEYDGFRAKLIDELLALKDRTGQPFITEIRKREDWFRGRFMNDAPDLTLTLRDHGFVSIRNRRPALVRRDVPAGTHHPDGIFLAGGKGIAHSRGALRQIVDVAPTLLHSLGLPVPEDMEGSVAEEFFSPMHRTAKPVRIGPPTRPVEGRTAAGSEAEISEDEKEKLLNQLRMLGYVE